MNSTRTLKSIIVALLIALGFSLFYINSLEIDNSLCTNYNDETPSTLKIGLVGDMISSYKMNQLQSMGSLETRAVSFHIDTIQKFIQDIKKEVKKYSKNPKTEILGLRLYYAAYPNETEFGKIGYEELSSIPKNYGNRLTAVFLPTKINSSNEIIDFNPTDSTTYQKGLPKYIIKRDENGILIRNTSSSSNIEIMAITGTRNQNSSTSARNHGRINPPFDNNSKLSF